MSIKSLLRQATHTNQRAKIAFVMLCYVIFFILHVNDVFLNLLDSNASLFEYIFIIFFPLVWFLNYFCAGFLGFLVLGVCGLFSQRLALLKNYIVLCIIFLICAYPSFILGIDIFQATFLGFNLELIDFIKDKKYLMILAFYLKQIVWAFLLFGAFDVLYFWRQKQKLPTQIKRNVIFSIVLYVLTFGIYSLYYQKPIWI